ncbi:hypothetical protein [Novilysobacter arseniciresistens]|uniref:hypothetical protein n=1 Tax=Novilysobacter arseniciresistens TaxID=1385522 RepID=UPI001269D704|nr:hypothetical protein [Lysobacter arseniciresistens]
MSTNREVSPTISAQLPCGACEQCFVCAVERSIDALHNCPDKYLDCFVYLKDVAKAIAMKIGDAAALGTVVEVIAEGLRKSEQECLNAALRILDFEMIRISDNGQPIVVRLAP